MLTNPYHYTGPIINKKLFMGHHGLKSHIVHAFENTVGTMLCVSAETSMGKSTLLHQVEQSLSSCLPVFIDSAQINLLSAESVYSALIDGMIDCIKDCGCFPGTEGKCSISDGKRENKKQGSTKDYLIELVQGFEERGTSLQFALLIDDTDLIMDSPWSEDFFAYFQSLITDRSLKNHLSALWALTPEHQSEFTLCSSVFTLTPFDKAAVREMVERGFTHTIEQLTTEVFEKTRGHPLLVQYVLHELYGEKKRDEW